MNGEAENISRDNSWIDRLQSDVLDVPAAETERQLGAVNGAVFERIPYATLEYELERSRKRLAIWDILLAHMKAGAETWPEIRNALTEEEVDQIATVCDGIPLRDVLS
jgi:hypothetical protein